jgi:hypothetical protein
VPAPRVSDAEFISVWRRHSGNATAIARALGHAGTTGIFARRRVIEQRHGLSLAATRPERMPGSEHNPEDDRTVERRASVPLKNGTVIVFSDCHYWPGEPSAAHKALVKLCKELQPQVCIANGDIADFARLCRQDPQGWTAPGVPSVEKELQAMRERMEEVCRALPKKCVKKRTRGNHDTRFDRHLQMNAPSFQDVPGFNMAAFLPDWPESWSVFINEDTCVKHRYNNGVHATYNNVLKAGTNIVTGHLHRLQVTCWGDYRGRRYGVDTGTLADPDGPQFDYGEDGPTAHCSGFAVLTFRDGRLLMPELCHVERGTAYFRGRAV